MIAHRFSILVNGNSIIEQYLSISTFIHFLPVFLTKYIYACKKVIHRLVAQFEILQEVPISNVVFKLNLVFYRTCQKMICYACDD